MKLLEDYVEYVWDLSGPELERKCQGSFNPSYLKHEDGKRRLSFPAPPLSALVRMGYPDSYQASLFI